MEYNKFDLFFLNIIFILFFFIKNYIEAMFYIKKRLEISASHHLFLSKQSKCENLHGHNFIVYVYCKSEELDNSKITDLQILDVSTKTSLTHYIFIGTANSNRQVDSTVDNLRTKLKEEFNIIPKKAEGKSTGWVLLDLGDIFVNIFTPEAREEYKLEDLWTKEIK